jgi:hypothetical protein
VPVFESVSIPGEQAIHGCFVFRKFGGDLGTASIYVPWTIRTWNLKVTNKSVTLGRPYATSWTILDESGTGIALDCSGGYAVITSSF